ncbi:ThiF family adenylyltransferase [Bradyrhizobium sp. CCBAU 51753]|uniref:ThiF family adenylyltransferase n=1 Tax=Bradyrhizobium sp. CCBAU 51753 TaxID=1325100 RepID=UPI00188B4B1F|nr:ThiF family adenylyltransferase [Bradyrhizobium sp. CCBAU 51753]
MTETISNRHLLQATGLAEKPLHLAQRVRIVLDSEWASSRAGQLLASCLVNLLVRQVELVGTIEILCPPIAALIRQPNGDVPGVPFAQSLVLVASWAVGDRVEVLTPQAPAIAADVTIVIGRGSPGYSGTVLLALGNGWKAWIGACERGPTHVVPDSTNPLGPFLAAALAAGEVFKRGRGLLRGRFLKGDGYSLWSGQTSPRWDELEDGPELAGAGLRPIHIVGAGAVGNGLAYILANSGFADAYVVVIDDDTYDDTSLNRCFLAGHDDVDDPKVDAVAGAMDRSGIGVFKYRGTISQYLVADRTGLRADVVQQADDLSFDIVASCVDRGLSRQHVQGLAPSLLFGGSTLGLKARANFYPNRPGAACLSCFNPSERDGEKMRELEKKLRDLGVDDRAALLQDAGVDPQLIEDYLASPKCGTLGEAALRNLATRAPSQFSVGFVSLAAALLLATKMFQVILWNGAPNRADVCSFSFMNGGLGDSFLGPDDACEWGCQERRGQVDATHGTDRSVS